jgi:hypothetical protein
MSMPPFGFYALCLLLWLSLLALIAWLLLRSGAKGTNKLSGAAGCLLALAFGFMALLGALAVLLVGLADAAEEWMHQSAVQRLEFTQDKARGESAGRFASLRVKQAQPADGQGLRMQISRWLQRAVPGEIRLREEFDGAQHVRVFEFELSDSELAVFEEALQAAEPQWNLTGGGAIEFAKPAQLR